jgi:hypothetical protein
MSVLIPEALYVFTFYFILFNAFLFFTDRMILDKVKAFSIAIYVCYSISVLWEWPIQLTIYQNIDAVILSGFRALAIPFFFYTIYKMGWKPTHSFINFNLIIVCLGFVLMQAINEFGVNNILMFLHLYRLPWLYMFFSVILVLGYKSISKSTNI